nr:DUF1643 domain-containing protein [Acinetobacter indicus]
MEKGAEISECSKYRYSLWRIWDKDKPIFTFIGLNPSTADHVQDDPTITRCINFAKSWGAEVFIWPIYLHIELLNPKR